MTEFRTSKEALDKCNIKGQILPLAEIDVEQIRAMVEFADGDVQSAEKLMKGLDDKSMIWNNVYTSYYDALHKLADSFIKFDRITSLNHICLFAYLCEKHPELELDWNFFEQIRTKRNGIQYYGKKTGKEAFMKIQVQIKLYINLLKRSIKEKIKE